MAPVSHSFLQELQDISAWNESDLVSDKENSPPPSPRGVESSHGCRGGAPLNPHGADDHNRSLSTSSLQRSGKRPLRRKVSSSEDRDNLRIDSTSVEERQNLCLSFLSRYRQRRQSSSISTAKGVEVTTTTRDVTDTTRDVTTTTRDLTNTTRDLTNTTRDVTTTIRQRAPICDEQDNQPLADIRKEACLSFLKRRRSGKNLQSQNDAVPKRDRSLCKLNVKVEPSEDHISVATRDNDIPVATPSDFVKISDNIDQKPIVHLTGGLLALNPVFWCPVKLKVSTILSLQESPHTPGLYEITNHPINRVELVGVVTEKTMREKYVKYKIEDTSGPINSMQWTTNNCNFTEYCIGDLVRVRGKITSFREEREIKIYQIFQLHDMNQLSLHLAHCHQTLEMLATPFRLPDTEVLAVQFEEKIRAAIVENILSRGPCKDMAQYKELNNVRSWLGCLTALKNIDEDAFLSRIDRQISQSAAVEQDIRKIVQDKIGKSLEVFGQVTVGAVKRQHVGQERQIDAVIDRLVAAGDIYELGDGVYSKL